MSIAALMISLIVSIPMSPINSQMLENELTNHNFLYMITLISLWIILTYLNSYIKVKILEILDSFKIKKNLKKLTNQERIVLNNFNIKKGNCSIQIHPSHPALATYYSLEEKGLVIRKQVSNGKSEVIVIKNIAMSILQKRPELLEA